jgi:hypothetical protein
MRLSVSLRCCRFGTRYQWQDGFRTKGSGWDDDDVKRNIIRFTQLKLINEHPAKAVPGLKPHQRLACLAQRLALKFNSTTYTGFLQEQEQVEGHMRVCLRVEDGFESMKTVSPSEPILAEAAAAFMSGDYDFDVPEALKSVLEGFSINPGDRGELVVLLLLCLARDMAVKKSIPGTRVVSVTEFMLCLLNDKRIWMRKPSMWTEQTKNNTFKTDFDESWIYCSHFIKVHEHKLLDRKYLSALIFRGAGIICGNSQEGVDIAAPFLYRSKMIKQIRTGLMLLQIKNYQKYAEESKWSEKLFSRMDPRKFGMVEGEDSVPVIRIIFSLAASQTSLSYVTPSESESKFTSYDFWCGGLKSEVLVPVEAGRESTWAALLQASRPWQAVYRGDREESRLKRTSNPGAGSDRGHWENWYLLEEDE